MSGWDWIHAGLELATYTQARSAQQTLAGMKTTADMEAARRAMLEAMRSFVFDISRDIQLAEEQIKTFPQQVYIVARCLEWRLGTSGLSADIFPEFQDKEYVFKTQRRIPEVVAQSSAKLTPQQVQESDLAVQFINEMPLLQRAISAISAQESLTATDEQWRKLNSQDGNRKLFLWLGIAGLVVSVITIPLLGCDALSRLGGGQTGQIMGDLIMLAIAGAISVGSLFMVIRDTYPSDELARLKTKREGLRKQVMYSNAWQQVVSTFGNLTGEQFRKIYDERLA